MARRGQIGRFGSALARGAARAEAIVDARLSGYVRHRPGWRIGIIPYVGHGTATRASLRARVLVLHQRTAKRTGRGAVLANALAHYLSFDVPGVEVVATVAGRQVTATAGPEGYVEVAVELPNVAPGWHDVSWRPASDSGTETPGRLQVIDAAATLGIVSDLDDTVIHTGLTRLVEAVRTTLLTPEDSRLPIAGAAELYRGLVGADRGRAPVFYVSTGAWNLHSVLMAFLDRNRFPIGPLLLTDWGPGRGWLLREGSVAVKPRIIGALIEEYPQLRWVLVGDSGQDDPEAYAALARAWPGRIQAIYIREVPLGLPARSTWVRRLATELAAIGVPMLLVRDSVAAAEHAYSLGLLSGEAVARVRASVGGSPAPRP